MLWNLSFPWSIDGRLNRQEILSLPFAALSIKYYQSFVPIQAPALNYFSHIPTNSSKKNISPSTQQNRQLLYMLLIASPAWWWHLVHCWSLTAGIGQCWDWRTPGQSYQIKDRHHGLLTLKLASSFLCDLDPAVKTPRLIKSWHIASDSHDFILPHPPFGYQPQAARPLAFREMLHQLASCDSTRHDIARNASWLKMTHSAASPKL